MPTKREPFRTPPLGLMSKQTHKKIRFHDICGAIARYYSAGMKIPTEWVEEYNELLDEAPET